MVNNLFGNFVRVKFIFNKPLFGFLGASIFYVSCSQSTLQQTSNITTHKPQMVNIPAGSFEMGSNCCKREDEIPVHQVTIKAFKISQAEITFTQWDACIADGGCIYRPSDEGWGRGERPVINVSYQHITEQFIPWLNKTTGQTFRLPTEAEWEYAARASSTTMYTWGDEINCSQAQYGRSGPNNARKQGGECSKSYDGTVEVKSFSPNSFGLYDMHGNAWELVEDCYHDSYNGAPSDGSAWLNGDCAFDRVIRGGGWYTSKNYLRSADRNGVSSAHQDQLVGFRLAQEQ